MADVKEYALDLKNNIYRAASVLARQSSVEGQASPGSDFVLLGQMKNTEVSLSENNTEEDTSGRMKTLTVDLEATTTLQQTSNTEIQNLRALTQDLMDVIFTKRAQSGDLTESEVADITEADDTATYPQNILDGASFTTDDHSVAFYTYDITVTLSEPSGTDGAQTADIEILDGSDNVLASVTGVTVPQGGSVTKTLETDTDKASASTLAIKVSNTGGGSDIDFDSFTISARDIVRLDSVLVNVNGTLNFSGDESEIGLTVPYRISPSDIPTKMLNN